MLKEYPLGGVLLKDPVCINAFEKDVAYLKRLDEERLLAGFYETAGLASKKMRYGGWENMLIGGHTLGHYLTAASQAYANAQCSEEDREILFGKIRRIIDGLLECQAHSKGKSGFVFGAIIRDPENVELQFDLVEQGKTNIITESWVPWYTMHKILDGVVKCYRLCAYEPALTLGSGIGDWTYARASAWSRETHHTVLSIEYGGMNDALYELYQCTQKPEHLMAAHLFDEEELFKAVMKGERNVLNNRHANTTIPKFLGALKRYMTLGDTVYLDYVKCFWDMVIMHHSYATGGNSEWEHFGEDDILDAERTNCNNETCNTYNMLKMTRELFRITGEKKYAEYYENTLINAILSSQNPESGMTMYFQPMATGYFKVYGTEFDKFWCCTGSGMENFTKLNDSIYFSDEEGIFVNLFISSELKDEALGIKLIQESDFPRRNTARFTLKATDGRDARQLKLRIRKPDWADESVLKAEGLGVKEEGGYFVAEGLFRDGAVLELRSGMSVRAKGLPDCDHVFAFSYGPLLLSAELGIEDMKDSSTGVDVTIPANKLVKNEYLTVSEGTAEEYIRNINRHLIRQGEELRFILTGTDMELTFTPHFSKTRERYGIYWYFLDREGGNEAAEEQRRAREEEEKRREALLDTVQPGYGQYENDAFHDMEEKNTTGVTDLGTSRQAGPGGYFSYFMRAAEGEELLLELHLLREDNGKMLAVSVGEEEIFRKRLHYTGRLSEYVLKLPLAEELVRRNLLDRKSEEGEVPALRISFRGGMFEPSARVFGFIYLLKKYL
ncbi:MAG: glycoside hydrolase family 127 protein [Lachnospiraceae bacterium]|nr:glycoside hydrolase family 127 protein [Lachnospiraceae bacterium]